MADTWEARVTAGNITVSEPGPGSFGYSSVLIGAMYYAFVAQDLPDTRYPTIKVFYRVNAGGTDFETYEQHGFSSGGDAQAGFVPHGSGTSSFTGTTEFESGGLLKITKDETAGEYQFAGLIGTSTVPFSVFGGVSAGELAPDRVYVEANAVSTFDDGTFFTTSERDTALTVRYDNFFGAKNGTDIKGATLDSTDRGSWEPPSGSYDPWFVTTSADATDAIADTGSAVGFAITIDGEGPVNGPVSVAYLAWDQAVYLVSGGSGGALDMTRAPEHGTIWAAIIYDADKTVVKVRRTFDAGGTWEEISAATGGTAANSVSINWCAGRVWLVWEDSGSVLQSNSFSLGSDWSSSMTLSISGTNPRHLVDPYHGMSYYFVISGGNLVVYRSADFGVTFLDVSPVTVSTGVETQTPAATIAPNGAIMVGYMAAGSWTQLSSLDWGRSWG